MLDPQSLVHTADRDALDVILRRTEALIAEPAQPMRRGRPGQAAGTTCGHPQTQAQDAKTANSGRPPTRESLAMEALAVRRQVVFSNPRLDFSDILFIARGVNYGTTKDGDHMVSAYYGFNGMRWRTYIVRDFKSRPRSSTAWQLGCRTALPGQDPAARRSTFAELSYDGKSVLFAFTEKMTIAGRASIRGAGLARIRPVILVPGQYRRHRGRVDS